MGFMITVTSNWKWGYLVMAILVALGGIALTIAGFATSMSAMWPVGIIVALVGGVFTADAISNVV